jgi:hypothetical protein
MIQLFPALMSMTKEDARTLGDILYRSKATDAPTVR